MKSERFTLGPGPVDLAAMDPADTAGYHSKSSAREKLQADIGELIDLQDRLNAQARNAVLLVFQGMDTAGKDGAIKHVMSGVNPAGVNVYNFRQPTAEERSHAYLWRAVKVLPARGRIAIFNRSYYEDVLVTRVHPELLGAHQAQLDEEGEAFWERRFREICGFERYLSDNDTVVIKFFLFISREEQKRRLLKRIDDPSKHWKFSTSDLKERPFWSQYSHAFSQMLEHTNTVQAPWYVIPSDHKWFARLAIASVLAERLRALHPEYPPLDPALETELARAKAALGAEDAG